MYNIKIKTEKVRKRRDIGYQIWWYKFTKIDVP